MTLHELTSEQIQRYFEARLPGQRFAPSGENLMARCPFHEDHKASLSLNVRMGVWICHAGCGAGGLRDFEKKISNCDDHTAVANIAEILGVPQLGFGAREPEAIYRYRDEADKVLFEKLRYPGKRFVQRKPDGQGGYDYALKDTRRALYHLPEIVTANHVIICEGEKDADRVNSLNLTEYDSSGFTRLVATTNVEGAGKWRLRYASYFAGKDVAILPDNDELGKSHA